MELPRNSCHSASQGIKMAPLVFHCGVSWAIFSTRCIHRTNCRAIAIMFVCPSVCLSGTGMYCDHMVHFSADLSSQLDSPMF